MRSAASRNTRRISGSRALDERGPAAPEDAGLLAGDGLGRRPEILDVVEADRA